MQTENPRLSKSGAAWIGVGDTHAVNGSVTETVRHGEGGWQLAKYDWRDGVARFLYIRNTGERRAVTRQQKDWCVNAR